MTILKAIILGVIQGITEFLPISSSGHLTIAQHYLQIDQPQSMIFFDLICHLGTLLAIIFFYAESIKALFQDKAVLKQIFLAILPLFPLVLILKPIKSIFDEPLYVGYLFLINSAILFMGTKLTFPPFNKRTWSDPFLIGLAQAIAVLPGISRSGSTISMAKGLGWETAEAIRFSFLLAIPTILGASTLELAKELSKQPLNLYSIPLTQYFLGFLTSFIIGYFSLKALQKIAKNNKFSYFAWYSLGIGILTLYYFN